MPSVNSLTLSSSLALAIASAASISAGADSAVDLNGDLYFVVNAFALVVVGPLRGRAETLFAELFPHLLAQVRSERAEQTDEYGQLVLCQRADIVYLVEAGHHRGDRGVELHVLNILRDLFDCLVHY